MTRFAMPEAVPTAARILVLALAGLGASACGERPADPGITVSSAGATQRTDSAARAAIGARVDASRRTAIVSAVESVSPAVVSINVTSRQRLVPRLVRLSAWQSGLAARLPLEQAVSLVSRVALRLPSEAEGSSLPPDTGPGQPTRYRSARAASSALTPCC